MDSTADTPHGEESLRSTFARGKLLLQKLSTSNLPSRSDEYQEQARRAVRLLRASSAKVRQLSLFSINETADDHSTGDLNFIMVNAYLSEALQKLSGDDKDSKNDTRISVLSEAQSAYIQFLTTCRDLGLLSSSDREFLNQTKLDEEREDGRMPGLDSKRRADPAKERMQRIERYKREKATRQKIQELEAKIARSTADTAGNDDDDLDEVEREHVLSLIDLKIQESIKDLEMLRSEIEMAKQMDEMRRKKQDNAGSNEGPSGSDANNWRLDDPSLSSGTVGPDGRRRPAFNARGQPMQPFVLTSDRAKIKQSVFRPGWNLPTMTVDEYLEQEQERGNIISGGGKEPEPKAEVDDNDYEALDAETMKQREWDDFKDDNPRGWGNRGGNKG